MKALEKYTSAAMSDRVLLLIFLFLASCSIIGASYVGINGAMPWRQADTYSQLLGFLGYKNLRPLDNFERITVVYDIPIYQYVVAKLSLIVRGDVLVVVRYFNLACWGVILLAGSKILRMLGARNQMYFLMLFTASPLVSHYFSTPLPDTLATAFSIMAVALMLENERTWMQCFLACTLILLAALIKSPIPFVFVFLYFAIDVFGNCRHLKGFLSIANLIFYSIALLGAAAAEIIRKNILSVDVKGFAQDPSWYFGTFALRRSIDFWMVFWSRLGESFPFKIIFYALVVCIVLYLLLLRKRGVAAMVPMLLAVLAGWLVFANVYFIHDYYQIPVSIVFFMACALAMDGIATAINSKIAKSTRKGAFSLPPMFPQLVVIGITTVMMIYGRSIGDRKTEGIYDSIAYAMRDVKQFVWVEPDYTGPTMGGYVKTPYIRMDQEVLDAECSKVLKSNEAVVVNGWSACLQEHKAEASTYIEDAGLQVYINRYRHRDKYFQYYVERAATMVPLIDSVYKVYLFPDEMVYIKKNCKAVDTVKRFFLHFYKKTASSVLDFNFFDKGAMVGDACVTVRVFEKWQIKDAYSISTGQFNVKGGVAGDRIWQAEVPVR
ncbi:hypothetical protein [Ottowia testudinis]|uniref:Dolichyl-phosphate-mannose-protein mannosyltransferase n=1 Tax=Ottowia testudinis TaxID=2816950 RepID=A0A975CIG5_9BURK|nr:hypothetical protein [Ottowia testudinis]QTD47048.1 hypothetical protein J1M35_09380 [Ottowia testudinis]